VFFSDTPVPSGTLPGAAPWHRIMSIQTDRITIWPIQQRSWSIQYGDPLFGDLDRLIVANRTDGPYPLPRDIADLDDCLLLLPDGFYKDWRLGLGIKFEIRSILQTIATVEGVTTVVFHGSKLTPVEGRLDPPLYSLGMYTFDWLRGQIASNARRHQAAARKERRALCHNTLLSQLEPNRFARQRVLLPTNALADLVNSTRGNLTLAKRDQAAAVTIVQSNASSLASAEPQAMMRLKQEIELVTLRELIDRCSKLLDVATPEARWQKLLTENPFIFNMAFHYPVVKIQDQPYVGGKLCTGREGSVGDVLLAAAKTMNLALVEIKRPGIPLLGKQYRGVSPPSVELSGTVAQVVAQRAELLRSFSVIGRDLDRAGYRAHSIACVVIIGLSPKEDGELEGFELYRQNLQGVHVVTFDELVERLQGLLTLLSGGTDAAEPDGPDGGVPF